MSRAFNIFPFSFDELWDRLQFQCGRNIVFWQFYVSQCEHNRWVTMAVTIKRKWTKKNTTSSFLSLFSLVSLSASLYFSFFRYFFLPFSLSFIFSFFSYVITMALLSGGFFHGSFFIFLTCEILPFDHQHQSKC